MNEIGWVFIYVSVFGLSDYFVKKYLNDELKHIFYYICIGILGYYLIRN